MLNNQTQAIEQSKDLAGAGNSDAALALHWLKHAPGIHPFLKEILRRDVIFFVKKDYQKKEYGLPELLFNPGNRIILFCRGLSSR